MLLSSQMGILTSRIKGFLFFLNSVILTISVSAQERQAFSWPEKYKAAVCLTFDDGLDSHLDIAAPLLNQYDFKGTFFCTGKSSSLSERMSDWKSMVKKGHELGNHSLFHPCDGRKFDWVSSEYDLSTYSKERITTELEIASTLLRAIDGKTNRTYGYTCSNLNIANDSSYVPITKKLFSAARADGPLPKNMKNLDLHLIPSWSVDGHSGKELINYVRQAKRNKTLAVFMFHSVGGGYLNVSKKALITLLDFLHENKDEIWTDTFMNVTTYIKEHQ